MEARTMTDHFEASKSNETALVTGASSGIGYELAVLLARHGFDLVLVSRNRTALTNLANRVTTEFGVKATLYPTDLSERGSARELFTQIQKDGITIDCLVNNAGFAMQGPLVDQDNATLLDMLEVNVTALTHLIRLFLPGMVDRGNGRILNVASIGAFMPGPMMAAYFASKAYVLSLSEALANEVHGTGVTVTAMCPGPTRTKFAQRARLTESKAFRGNLMEADSVALEGFEAMMKGRAVVIPGLKHRIQLFPTPLVPRRILAYFARQYHETSNKGIDAAKDKWEATPAPAAGRPAHQ
jgi:short-subunit dehydrogenase